MQNKEPLKPEVSQNTIKTEDGYWKPTNINGVIGYVFTKTEDISHEIIELKQIENIKEDLEFS